MADPDSWYSGTPAAMGKANYDEWRRAVRDPDTIRAMLEDYRAGLTIDRQDEEADRQAGRKIIAPLLVLWSLRDDLEDLYGDPLKIWEPWASDICGHGIDSGHHMAEDAPDELTAALLTFLQS
jgi:haloacetate dehalogenase